MTKLVTFILVAASCNAGAVPFGGARSNEIQKRQFGGGLGALLGASLNGNMGKFMGEPEAKDALQGLARMLGASKTGAGGLQMWTRNMLNAGYGIVAGNAERRVKLTSRTPQVEGSETIKIRYGPYKVPKMSKKNMLGEGGMLSNYPHDNMEKPCSGDCTIMGISAGLELLDGSDANIDKGLWLHHMVMFNKGPGREDFTCRDTDISVPHVSIGATSRNSERFFASGNERTMGIFPEWNTTDAGYKINAKDSFAGLIELMNENMDDKTVYMTITYDIVKGHPFKDNIRVVWFDIRQCGTSEANPPKGKNRFTFEWTWQATIDAEVIGAIGHLHDGGSQLRLSVDDKETCTNPAKYGTKPEYVQKNAMGHHSMGALTHISDMKPCYGDDFPHKRIRKGQNWKIFSDYDFDAFKGMKHEDGDWDEVMGISIMFVRIKDSS